MMIACPIYLKFLFNFLQNFDSFGSRSFKAVSPLSTDSFKLYRLWSAFYDATFCSDSFVKSMPLAAMTSPKKEYPKKAYLG